MNERDGRERARAEARRLLSGLMPGNTGVNMANEMAEKIVTAYLRQPMTMEEVMDLAVGAHDGQSDKNGVPYIQHVLAVAEGLNPFGDTLVMAGLLHDVIEDTPWTAEGLTEQGVPPEVVRIVKAVTNVRGVSYQNKIVAISKDREATLVKIADNAHNSRADRLAKLPEKDRLRLEAKYQEARAVLWGSVAERDVRLIVSRVNPDLLTEGERKTVESA